MPNERDQLIGDVIELLVRERREVFHDRTTMPGERRLSQEEQDVLWQRVEELMVIISDHLQDNTWTEALERAQEFAAAIRVEYEGQNCVDIAELNNWLGAMTINLQLLCD